MSSPTLSSPPPQHKQLDSEQASESNLANSESGEESTSSGTDDSSYVGDKLKDDKSADPRGSEDASVALSNADAGKGSGNESDGLLPEMLDTLEDLTSDRTPTLASDPRESAEVQVNADSRDFKDEKTSTLQDQPNKTPERHDNDRG